MLAEWLFNERNRKGANAQILNLLEQLPSIRDSDGPPSMLAAALWVEVKHTGNCSKLWMTFLRGAGGFSQLTEPLAELSHDIMLVNLFFDSEEPPADLEVLIAPFIEALADEFWSASYLHHTSHDQQWINLHIFAARLWVNRGLHPLSRTTSYTLVEALEQHPWTDFPLLEKETSPMDSDTDSFEDSSSSDHSLLVDPNPSMPLPGEVLDLGQAVLLNKTVPAAAMWIKRAGEQIYLMTGEMTAGRSLKFPIIGNVLTSVKSLDGQKRDSGFGRSDSITSAAWRGRLLLKPRRI